MLKQIPMTIKGAEQLKEELQRLKSVDRPNIIQAISEARAQGDLSENAEYESAKERQSFIEGRIAEIEAKLSTAMVIDPSSIVGESECVFGSTVEVQDLDTEDIFTTKLWAMMRLILSRKRFQSTHRLQKHLLVRLLATWLKSIRQGVLNPTRY